RRRRPGNHRGAEASIRRSRRRRHRGHQVAAASPPSGGHLGERDVGISTKEISEVIKERLKDFDASLVSADVGRIVAVGDGIAQIYGLQNAMAGELLEFPHDVYGLALNRSEEHTSELQSRENLVCRLLLEKKKNKK